MGKIKKQKIVFIAIAAVTLLLNIIGIFILPDNIKTSITFDGSAAKLMNKFLYLISAFLVICVPCGCGMFLEGKQTKYIVLSSVLAAANLAVVILNIA